MLKQKWICDVSGEEFFKAEISREKKKTHVSVKPSKSESCVDGTI